MRWYLIGFMGVGKSTHGRNLAEDLDLPFVDLDKEIEAWEARSIEDIFASHGEPYFRKVEYDVLMSVSKRYEHAVISTGGGLPCQGQNMKILSALGKTLYLQASVEDLVSRLAASKGKRPLLAGKDNDDLKHFVADLLEAREPFYSQAEIIVKLDLTREIEENRLVIRQAIEG